jgi:hypothetical protein
VVTVPESRLFDDLARTDRTPARQNEDLFSFLNRSAVPFFAEVREQLETWVAALPADHRPPIIGAIRSRDRERFEAALWEVFLFHAYTGSGFDVTIHPPGPGATRPDFLVVGADQRFYLEAVRVGRPPEEIAAERRLGDVYAVLDTVPADRFKVSVTSYQVGTQPLATKRLRSVLVDWLAGLDPATVVAAYERSAGFGALPRMSWVDADWRLEFHAFPLKVESAGRAGGLVGMRGPGEARIVDNITGILRALDSKVSKYGQLDAPLVIAVLSNTEYPTDDYEFEQALFGVASQRPARAAEHPDQLFRDGHWLTRKGWRRGHAPQVIAGQGLNPWNVARTVPRLWSTLQPSIDLPDQPDWLARVDVSTPEATPGSSRPLHEVFGLPADWLDRKPEWE